MATNLGTLDPSSGIHRRSISHITFETKKKFAYVELYIVDGKTPRLKVDSKSTSKIVFHVPKDLILESRFSLRLVYRHTSFSARKHTINIGIQDILNSYMTAENGNKPWTESYGRDLSCQLAVDFRTVQEGLQPEGEPPPGGQGPGLRPTTERILEVCPHFRILVIGKTGAGKSSLIYKAFGVNEEAISDKSPGKADIETEIRSELNPQFILHDSLGFEHGEEDNLETVKGFVQRRDREPELRRKLHAIWICHEIPNMNGRLVESGVENFLKLKTDGSLGDVPVIMVFTKYDKLVDTIKRELYKNNPGSIALDEDAMDEDAKNQACLEVKKLIQPMEKFMEAKVPHVVVSTSEEWDYYTQSVRQLIEVTFNTVFAYLADASIVTAIAQKVSPDVKIRAIIEVGKQKYWSGLGSSLNFPTYTLERCLGVIHTDIVRVWSFKDEADFLLSAEFRALLANGVDFKAEGKSNATLSVGLSMIAALASIVSVLSGPAAPIVIPIAGAFVFAAWVREVYVQSKNTLRRLMTYIVDLTLVTQNLFWIQTMLGLDQTFVTRRMIKLAFLLHINSSDRNKIINRIEEYSKITDAIVLGGADKTFQEIEKLINSSLIRYEDNFRKNQKDILEKWEAQRDEDWNLSVSTLP